MIINNILALAVDCFSPEIITIMSIVGIVVWGIKIGVPIILIIVGMVELAKAVTKKDDKDIKSAQNLLLKKAVTAVIVFLVPTLVTLIMGIISANEWKPCWKCISNPRYSGTFKIKDKDSEGKEIEKEIPLACKISTDVN